MAFSLLTAIKGLTCLQDCMYVGINLGINVGPVLKEEFTENKQITSLKLGGTPFHEKFIKNYFGYVLSSNVLVTYALFSGPAVATALAAPVCLWNMLFHGGILFIEYGSKTYKELHLPLHASFITLWGALGVGALLKLKK